MVPFVVAVDDEWRWSDPVQMLGLISVLIAFDVNPAVYDDCLTSKILMFCKALLARVFFLKFKLLIGSLLKFCLFSVFFKKFIGAYLKSM